MTTAEFKAAEGLWYVKTADGRQFKGRVLVCADGAGNPGCRRFLSLRCAEPRSSLSEPREIAPPLIARLLPPNKPRYA